MTKSNLFVTTPTHNKVQDPNAIIMKQYLAAWFHIAMSRPPLWGSALELHENDNWKIYKNSHVESTQAGKIQDKYVD